MARTTKRGIVSKITMKNFFGGMKVGVQKGGGISRLGKGFRVVNKFGRLGKKV